MGIRCFRLATAGVADVTQVDSRRRYAEFGEVLFVIDALDAGVICLEVARSRRR
jgi:5-methyltetrahydropteroyltriglutamate--homocysteine methyltransferase